MVGGTSDMPVREFVCSGKQAEIKLVGGRNYPTSILHSIAVICYGSLMLTILTILDPFIFIFVHQRSINAYVIMIKARG